MHNVVGVEIPAGVDGEAVRADLLDAPRHRDRHLLRSAPRSDLAHRHDGLQRPVRRRAAHARRARVRAGGPRRSTGHRPSRRRRRGRPTPATADRPIVRRAGGGHRVEAPAVLGHGDLLCGQRSTGAVLVLADVYVIRPQATVTRCSRPPQRGARTATDTVRSDGRIGWEERRANAGRWRAQGGDGSVVALCVLPRDRRLVGGLGITERRDVKAHHDHPCRDAHHRDRVAGQALGTRSTTEGNSGAHHPECTTPPRTAARRPRRHRRRRPRTPRAVPPPPVTSPTTTPAPRPTPPTADATAHAGDAAGATTHAGCHAAAAGHDDHHCGAPRIRHDAGAGPDPSGRDRERRRPRPR